MTEKDQNQDELFDRDLLARNEGIQSPAFWFFLLLIPIVISLYFAFTRPSPQEAIPAQKAAQEQQIQQKQETQAKRPGQGGVSPRTGRTGTPPQSKAAR